MSVRIPSLTFILLTPFNYRLYLGSSDSKVRVWYPYYEQDLVIYNNNRSGQPDKLTFLEQ